MPRFPDGSEVRNAVEPARSHEVVRNLTRGKVRREARSFLRGFASYAVARAAVADRLNPHRLRSRARLTECCLEEGRIHAGGLVRLPKKIVSHDGES